MMKTSNADSRRLIAILFALSLAAAPIMACAGPPADDSSAADGGAVMANDAGENQEGGGEEHGEGQAEGEDHGEAEGEHVHPASDEIVTRADEVGRDEYSKPLEVYEFVGISEGDTVVDTGAGSGYNTFLLSGLVGPSGRVYAERGNDDLAARIEGGDLREAGNITIVESLAGIPDGSADAVMLVREYHLVPDYLSLMVQLSRVLRPDGVLGVVEVRSDEARGHNMETHRLGEETVVEQFGEGGFELVEESEILRRDDDDYTVYGGPEGLRYVTDRMLMKFVKAR